MNQGSQNVYLEQVIQQQEKVDQELRRKAAPASFGAPAPLSPAPGGGGPQSEPAGGRGVDYHITGSLWWRNVVVPPNVYVIHTRRGHERPVHIGLGISFRFNPYTDAFLIIPAAVQTLLINANCICIERQGVLVQAYVQWIIDDIGVAYRKLDFSDPADPMRVVNVQLREQAEAAIKDKVATMSIDEILSDKQPIIQELTHRLRLVVEGEGEGEQKLTGGMGLKIVTVQIKEAVVSSTRVWQNLQIPFRAEREKVAKLAQLESERQVSARELENRARRETEEIEAEQKLAQLRAEQERRQYDLQHAEELRRQKLQEEAQRASIQEQNATAKLHSDAELELALHQAALEKKRIAADIERSQLQSQLDKVQAEREQHVVTAALGLEELRNLAEDSRLRRELARLKTRREIDNTLSPALIQKELIEKLPEIAEHLPAPQEQRTTLISGVGDEGAAAPLLRFLAGALGLVENLRAEEIKLEA